MLVVGGVLEWGGSIGLYAVATAVALGADRVRFVSQDAEQCRLAAGYGAETALVEGTDYPDAGRFDVTVDTSGVREGLAHALRSTGPYGVCTCTAGAVHRGDDVALPVHDMYLQCTTLRTGWVSTRPLVPAASGLLTAGLVDPLAIAQVVPWSEAGAALSAPFRKVVVVR